MFATFPEVLVLALRRFELKNWVPEKLQVPLSIGNDIRNLEKWRGHGLQPGETLLPDESNSAATIQPCDPHALSQLMEMGFPEVRCRKALLATTASNGEQNAEVAMQWLFEHMDDPGTV